MSIAPLPPIGASAPVAAARPAPAPAAEGFGAQLQEGLSQVSALESGADRLTQSLATGGPAQVHELMIATTKAQLGVDMLVQVRNRAVEAYQEVMRLQV
jgi:flagellar hook-basal body complex protein FliE